MAEELEAMRAEDFSWHPCKVSLNSTRDGLSVEFESQDLGGFMLSKELVLGRLRFRSLPLQGDDCSRIEEGELVIAIPQKGDDACFFDAKLEKVLRVRHYRGPCRCSFTVKWIHRDHKDDINVPSGSLKKLSKESISASPIVAAVLKAENKRESFICLPSNETSSETDLTKRLEKQMEKIGYSIDLCKKEVSEGNPPGNEVKRMGSGDCVASSKVAHQFHQKSSEQNHSRRTTRSSINVKLDVEVAIPPEPAPAVIQEFAEKHRRHSPLAACAALASRVQIPGSVVRDGASMFGGVSINSHIVVDESKNRLDPIVAPPVAVIPAAREPIKNARFHISLERETSSKNELADFPLLGKQATPSRVKVGTPECASPISEEGGLVLGIPSSTFHSRGTNTRHQQKVRVVPSPTLQDATVTKTTSSDASESIEALRHHSSPERSASCKPQLVEQLSRERAGKIEVTRGISERVLSCTMEQRILVLAIPISTFYSTVTKMTNKKRVTRSTVHEQKDILVEEVEIEPGHEARVDFSEIGSPRRKICKVQNESAIPFEEEKQEMFAAILTGGDTQDNSARTRNQIRKTNDTSSEKQLGQFPPRRTRSQSKS